MVKKILVALDGSPSSDRALDLAIQLATSSEATLLALTVISPEPLMEADLDVALEKHQPEISELLVAPAFRPALAPEYRALRAAGEAGMTPSVPLRKAMAQHILAEAKATAQERGFAPLETMLRSGDPATAILATAATQLPDLLIMGSRGLGERAKNLIGGVSYRVVRQAACPVVIVKYPELED